MVQAMIEIDEHTNMVLNIVKAKFGLSNKSQAIQAMAEEYEEELLEPPLRPEFVDKIRKIEKTAKFVRVKNIDEYFEKLRKR